MWPRATGEMLPVVAKTVHWDWQGWAHTSLCCTTNNRILGSSCYNKFVDNVMPISKCLYSWLCTQLLLQKFQNVRAQNVPKSIQTFNNGTGGSCFPGWGCHSRSTLFSSTALHTCAYIFIAVLEWKSPPALKAANILLQFARCAKILSSSF